MAASAASAMASQSQSKKKAKKHELLHHSMRSSTDLYEFVKNDKSHVNHFWEAVKNSVDSTGHNIDKERHKNYRKKMNELEVADCRTNADEIRQKLLINPNSKYKTGWDFLLAVLVIYTLVCLPLRIAFSLEEIGLIIFDYIIDGLFVVDIFINFNTSYDATPDNDHDDVLETNRCKVALEYMKGWFIIDLLATIPFDSIVRAASNDPDGNYLSIRLIRIIRLLKLLKLFRVIKLKTILDMLDEVNISAGIISIFVLVLQIIFMCHIICCFWYYLATPDAGADVNHNWVVNTWPDAVANEGLQNVTVVCGAPGANAYPDCKTKSEIYIASFYWVMTTMTTVGYGDIRAHATSERLYSCFVILCGSIMFGAVITKVTKLIINRNPQATNLKAKMDDLKGYLNEKHLSRQIKEQAIESYIYYMHKKSLISELGVFDEMPKPLLVKLIQTIYQEEIQTIRAFKNYEDNFIVQIVINSMPFQVKANENVYGKGDLASDVTFIMSGVISIMDSENGNRTIKGYCAQGNFFGDFEFLKKSTYIGDYHAIRSCNLLSISSHFLSNYLVTNIESGLKFAYDIEDRYRKFRKVKTYPTRPLSKGDLIHEMVFLDGNVVSFQDERVREYTENESHKESRSPSETFYRVSKKGPNGQRIFIEETKEEIGRRCVVMHNGDYKMKWDIFIGVFIVYSVVAIPVQISFTTTTPESLSAFETMIDLLFGCDILISCRTTYYDEENDYFETISWNMFRHYLKTWFLIDVASTIPFDQLVTLFVNDSDGGGLASIRIIKFVRLFRIMKMFRLTKLVTLLNKLENTLGVSPAFFQLMQYLMIVILMVHFIACIWWYSSLNFTSLPWFAQITDPLDPPSSYLVNEDVGDQYIASLYFTFTTLATVGYGDLTPIRLEEQLLDSFIMLIGATVFGYMIASIASLVGGLNRSAAISQARISEITAYLSERSAPRDLTKEIVRYFTHMFEQKTAYDEAGILDRIPKTLKHKILMLQYGEILERIALFNYIENASVVLYIFENLVLTYYEADKIILREGNFANSIMFLIYGKALITKAKSSEILRKKRFRHAYNRQREFFKDHNIAVDNNYDDAGEEVRKLGEDLDEVSRRTKSSFILDKNNYERIKERRGLYNPATIGKYNRSAAEAAGRIASGTFLEIPSAFTQSEEEKPQTGAKGRPKQSLLSRFKFSSLKRIKLDDDYEALSESRDQPTCGKFSSIKMKEFFVNDPEEDMILGELNAGQFCGHVAMMNHGGKHNASVVSLQACTFYTLTRQATYRILEEQPCVALVLEVALSEAILDLKTESENQKWWNTKKSFVNDVHLKHVRFKNNGRTQPGKKKSILTDNLVAIKLPNRIRIKRSFRRAMNNATKVFNASVYPQRDTPGDIAVAESRWDLVRKLIKKSKVGAKIAATTRKNSGLTANGGCEGESNYEGEPSTPLALESKSTIDFSQVSPSKKADSTIFSEVLRHDLGSELHDLVHSIVDAPVEKLEKEEESSYPPSIRRRVSSVPKLDTEKVFLPPSIYEGVQLNGTAKTHPSIYHLRRRLSFPVSKPEMASWRKDKAHLHVI